MESTLKECQKSIKTPKKKEEKKKKRNKGKNFRKNTA